MTPKKKLKIRFIIISSIIFIGLIILLLLHKYNPQIISYEWLFWSAIIIGSWFWCDKKLLYFKNYIIICLFLCLSFLFVLIIIKDLYYIATIPLAAMIGRIIANKKMDKIRRIDLDAKDELEGWFEERAKMMIYYLTTLVISGIIYLIIKLII